MAVLAARIGMQASTRRRASSTLSRSDVDPEPRSSRWRVHACIGLGILMGSGCGPRPPALEPTTGMVTLDGQPIDEATVTLAPTSGPSATASGITDSTGTFTLTTVVPGMGALAGIGAGEYWVTITKVKSASTAQVSDDPGLVAAVSENEPPKVTYAVPKGYGDANTSGLKATIAKGKNELKFELDSKFKP